MTSVRFGVIGLGNMGSHHANYLGPRLLDGATLGAICDVDVAKAEKFGTKFDVPHFANHRDLLASGTVDAIIIATPHYDHPPIAMDAFDKDIHVLCEKPVAVGVKAARALNEAYATASARNAALKFGIMFNQRSIGMHQKLREVILDGELGEISRITWLITDWFRTWTYYASGGWRATWAGEGGGVLINQCPHNLDLIQWMTGMYPSRVTAVASIGKTHPIEVEDDVSAILEYPNGAVGHFVTTTGEAPGTNRLEIVGDRGRIICENNKLAFRRARHSVREIREKSPEAFAAVECWDTEIPFRAGPAEQHKTITADFVKSIQTGSALLAPGIEGVHGLQIGNAMLMSGVLRKPVDLPLDGDAYDNLIKDLTAKYGGKKTLTSKGPAIVDMAASFVKT